MCPDVLLQLEGDDDGRGMLVRCCDTGATRGMTRLSDVAKSNLGEGPELGIGGKKYLRIKKKYSGIKKNTQGSKKKYSFLGKEGAGRKEGRKEGRSRKEPENQ